VLSRSFVAWFSAVAVACLVFAAGAHAAPSIKLKTTDQSALVTKGAKVTVTGKPGTTVRLVVKTRSLDEGVRNFSKPRKLRLGKSGRATVTVRATAAARSAARTCAPRTLTATARSGKARASSSRDMRRNRSDCRLAPVDLSKADDCDFIAQPNDGLCMLPFPNDYYTVDAPKDPSKGLNTGKRIDFTPGGMPKNKDGVPIDPTPYLASDGFSQGQGILLKVPGIDTPADIEANGFVGLDRLSRYALPNQKAVVIEADTGKRWPIWVDVDQTGSDPSKAALMISPSVNFNPGERYVVALRNLVDGLGRAIKAPNAFRYYRDDLPSSQPQVNARRADFESIFRTLRAAKVKRSSLYLAWDFTTASNANNYRRALHMRDQAFSTLGDTTMGDQQEQGVAPTFDITQVQPVNGAKIERRIRGTFTVPCFLTDACEPGGIMVLDENGLPERNGNYEANFTCNIPPVGLDEPDPPKLRPYIFGHGLVGTAEGVNGSINPNLMQDHEMIACATDEIGMANEDIPTIFEALGELSSFPVVPDRLQQGLLNELFLARLMFHVGGFGTDPAFQDEDGESVIRNDHVYYMGASQGGIMGGPLTAISPDIIQSALVVGAMNYSNLLTRSSNWELYGAIFDTAYPNELSRPLVLGLMQMLWDRGEPNGYAHVMTDDPPPNTPEHNVTLHVALGDHQVSNFASDIQARTVGMKTPAGGIDDQRWPDYEDLWNIPRIGADEYPFSGPSIVYWDGGPFRVNPDNPAQNIGTGLPPYGNVPPNDDWEDPHGAPRGAEGPEQMINTFFQPNGYIEDVCAGAPCLGSGWDGDYGSVVVPTP
jgi:hypothetical protein